MKITVKKRYICPASEVFEMGGNDVLLAGSIYHFEGQPDTGGGDTGGGGAGDGSEGHINLAPSFYTPVMSSKDYFLMDEDEDW